MSCVALVVIPLSLISTVLSVPVTQLSHYFTDNLVPSQPLNFLANFTIEVSHHSLGVLERSGLVQQSDTELFNLHVLSSLTKYFLHSVVPGVGFDAVEDWKTELPLSQIFSKTLVGRVVIQLQVSVVISVTSSTSLKMFHNKYVTVTLFGSRGPTSESDG